MFLRLRKAVRKNKTAVYAVAPFATRGLAKLGGHARSRRLPAPRPRCSRRWPTAPRRRHPAWPPPPQALAGERRRAARRRAAGRPCPARCPRPRPWRPPAGPAWPGSRAGPVSAARSRPAPLPEPAARRPSGRRRRRPRPGRRGLGRRRPARRAGPRHRRRSSRPPTTGQLGALRGRRRRRRPTWPRPERRGALAKHVRRLARGPRQSSVTAVADVVLPVAPHAEKGGTFVDWEGRARALRGGARRPPRMSRLPRAGHARRRDGGVPRRAHARRGPRRDARARPVDGRARRGPDRAGGRGARSPATARRSSPPGTTCSTAAACRTASRSSRAPRPRPRRPGVRRHGRRGLGVGDGDLRHRGLRRRPDHAAGRGRPSMVDHVVWLPTNSPGSTVRATPRRRRRSRRHRSPREVAQ